ncbi:DUF5997 family protein, partial [Streptomyces vietnamensis]|uniref:DUF5997 family protein n=1 Tax=Streptomyces vietnamensis TaxID=362257 RepID=UPI00341D1C3B
MTSHQNTQTMKPATAAKKLGVYLEATPAEFQEGVVSRSELATGDPDAGDQPRQCRGAALVRRGGHVAGEHRR